MMRTQPIARGRVAVLGIATITAYGAWFYAFGVLLDPIIEDTGWSEATLATAYGASAAITGAGSLAAGWLLDRSGAKTVFLLAAAVTAASFAVATTAQSLAVFAVTAAIGGGALGAFGFYHVTQTVAVRVNPVAPHRAIAVLTIWGAFSSALYLPLAAWLVSSFGWRIALACLAGTAVVALVGASFVRSPRPAQAAAVGADIWASLTSRPVRRFVIATGLAGVGASVILVYQVPAMTAAGLPIATASAIAGFRGLSQLAGRIPIAPMVARLGTRRSMQVAYLAIAAGTALLAVAGSVWIGVLYAVVAGFGIGAMSPLQGMYSHELFSSQSLGTAMGGLALVFGVAGAAGPALAGLVAESTGSRAWPVAGAAVLAVAAALVLGGGSAGPAGNLDSSAN